MRYLLLIYGPEGPPAAEIPPEIYQAEMSAYGRFTQETIDRGAYKGGEALQPVSTATTVRVREGRAITTDGPFAETKEQLGGFYLLDCKDLDEAIELAAKIPAAERRSIEIRPIWELPTDYASAGTPEAAAAAPR